MSSQPLTPAEEREDKMLHLCKAQGDQILGLRQQVSLRDALIDQLRSELALQKGANAAQDEREKKAAERFGMLHSCDWPDEIADKLLAAQRRWIDIQIGIEQFLTSSDEYPLAQAQARELLGDWHGRFATLLDVYVAERTATITKERDEAVHTLAVEENMHVQTIDERDHHEASINAIAAALGVTCEWSNLCDVGHECVEAVSSLAERTKVLREALEKIADPSRYDIGVNGVSWRVRIALDALQLHHEQGGAK